MRNFTVEYEFDVNLKSELEDRLKEVRWAISEANGFYDKPDYCDGKIYAFEDEEQFLVRILKSME